MAGGLHEQRRASGGHERRSECGERRWALGGRNSSQAEEEQGRSRASGGASVPVVLGGRARRRWREREAQRRWGSGRNAIVVACWLLEPVEWERNAKHCTHEAIGNLPSKMHVVVGVGLSM